MSVAFHSVAADLTKRKKERNKDLMSMAFHSVVADLTERKKERKKERDPYNNQCCVQRYFD